MEFHLWGKSELEDMLFLPKNDNILFAFFGISLITRRRSKATEIKFSINNKNKLLRLFSEGSPQREFRERILARDFKDVHYPWKGEYRDFDRSPRWKEYTAVGSHPLGLIVEVFERFAYLDFKTKRWDAFDAVNLLHHESEEDEERRGRAKKEEEVRNFWKYLPRANQAHLIVRGLIQFEDMMAIDDKGDSLFTCPHIFVDFTVRSGPFRGFYYFLKIKPELIPLGEEFTRIKFFPADLPSPPKGNIYRDRAIEFDAETLRQFGTEYFLNSIFDFDDRYAFLNQGDCIKIADVEPLIKGTETFIEVTYKYETTARDYLSEFPHHRHTIEGRIGRNVTESDNFTVLEFERVYSWQLENR